MRLWIADDAMRGHNRFTFQIVELSDPDAPKLGPSFEMPREDHGLGARLDGSFVHYWYKRPIGGGSSRYFVRRLDVSAPTAPQLSEPILVPGELLAVRGDSLYTRELVDDGELRAVLHHARLERDRAHIVASHPLGEPRLTALRLDGSHVYVDLGERLARFESTATDGGNLVPPIPARLLVLDANDLARIAEGDIAIGASQLAVRDEVAWYGVSGGLLRIDALEPEDVARRQFTTFNQPVVGPYVDLEFAGDKLLLVDHESKRLRLLDP